MTATPEPITLDELERRAVDLAARGSREAVDWESLLGDLQHLKFPGCPPLDPDAARESSEELRQLIVALDQQPLSASTPWAAEQLPRAGYFIEGERGTREAHVLPAFAQALAARASGEALRRAFGDLWSVDLGVWRQLVSGPGKHRALAHAWLTSPGRRLVQDLSVLGLLPGKPPPGAGEFSAERLVQATGPLPLEGPPGPAGAEPWLELHAAIPGAALSRWRPATDDVSDVLRILEGRRGDPVFLRGVALAWLLDRAATSPLYDLNGLQRDLREDLLLAFINGFPDKADSRYGTLRAAARLETACLLHAARLVPPQEAQSSARCWTLARWLQSCTFRSPFFGGDEEALAARLRALLPSDPAAIPRREDVLDPGCFGEGEEELDIAELALVAGAARHYWPDAEHPQLLPTPLPLVQALRRVASRRLNDGEREAEALLQRLQAPPSPESSGGEARSPVKVENALGWTAHHVAPPLVARWLMTHHRIAWLGQAPSETQRECLGLFEEDPARHEWVAFAVYSEGEQLDPGLRLEVPSLWNRVVRATGGRVGSKGALALMAMGVWEVFSGEEARVAELVREAEPIWRHRGFEALAEAAEKHSRSTPWRAALDGLLAMCADESLDVQERQRAVLLALRRVSATTRPERTEYLQRLVSLASREPFNQNVALRRELRRLGLPSAPDSKGAR